jgi:hypothetical protein
MQDAGREKRVEPLTERSRSQSTDERMEATMNKRILQGMRAGAFCAALAGAATGQMMSAMAADDSADAKSSPIRAGGETTPPAAPADAKSDSDSKTSAKNESEEKTTASSSKTAKHAKSTTEKKSTQHAAKSTGDKSATADEKAFRQALRGCATQQEQSQRDNCLDEAIDKFQRS